MKSAPLRAMSLIVTTCLGLWACAPAPVAPTVAPALMPATATLEPPATQPPATATARPPTAIVAPPTPTPTAIFTPDFAPGEMWGIWTRSDPERGQLYLIFQEDGTYRASHGTPEDGVHGGAFTLDGRLFTFLDGWNCSPKPRNTPGQYVVRLAADRTALFLDPVQDRCPDRSAAVGYKRWVRYEPK